PASAPGHPRVGEASSARFTREALDTGCSAPGAGPGATRPRAFMRWLPAAFPALEVPDRAAADVGDVRLLEGGGFGLAARSLVGFADDRDDRPQIGDDQGPVDVARDDPGGLGVLRLLDHGAEVALGEPGPAALHVQVVAPDLLDRSRL